MLSSARKFRKSFENYQEAIEKQLNDDFQVYEYLNQNNLQGNNTDEYLKLFNELQVKKNHQRKKFETLQISMVQMNSQNVNINLKSSQVQNWGGAKDQFLKSYQQTQIKISNQMQIKNDLWKQIFQTKKSLNLLKGDMGHLVSRNQSAKVLESKISKVKIIADDQLQRVTMAYVKDKDQLKQRGDMQKKFNKKLKNVSLFEDTTLNRLKRNYISTMVKKKQIHNKLNYIERIKGSINQPGELQRQKNLINKNSLELYRNFIKVKNLIQKIPQISNKYGCSSYQIEQFVEWLKHQENYRDDLDFQQQQSSKITPTTHNFLKSSSVLYDINSQDLQMITTQTLNDLQRIIKEENIRIIEQISNYTNVYNMQMKKSQQLVIKMQKMDEEIVTFYTNLYNEEGMQYIQTKQSRQQYSSKLKKLVRFLKTIFALLQYIEKNLNYSSIPFLTKTKSLNQSQISFMQQIHSCSQNNQQPFLKEKVSEYSKTQNGTQKSLMWINKNYISELYKTYYILLKDNTTQKHIQGIQEYIFTDLQSDIENWLTLIKEYLVDGKDIRLPTYWERQQKQRQNLKMKTQKFKGKDSRVSQIKVIKKQIQTQEEQAIDIKEQEKYNHQNYKRRHTLTYKQENLSKQKSKSKLSNSPSGHLRQVNRSTVHRNTMHHMNSGSNIINVNKFTSNSPSQHKEAQRIKLLKDIDQNYYKMLKSTLKMQKENTRKNYQFMRSFKRAKYSSNDQILQEKRFESSFSMMLSNKNDQTTVGQGTIHQKRSIFFKNNRTKNKILENNESRRKFQSSKLSRSYESSADFKKNGIKQLKQNNVSRITYKFDKPKINIKNKNDLTFQMKDILNLI